MVAKEMCILDVIVSFVLTFVCKRNICLMCCVLRLISGGGLILDCLNGFWILISRFWWNFEQFFMKFQDFNRISKFFNQFFMKFRNFNEIWMNFFFLRNFKILIVFPPCNLAARRCGCFECVTSRQEDSLRHSRSRINCYRALASPSLISLSSKDPILTAFELSWELRRLSFMEHEFKTEYQVLYILLTVSIIIIIIIIWTW